MTPATRTHSTHLLVLLFLLAVLSPAAYAQVLYGSIVGTVTDRSGAVVPNASVSVANVTNGRMKQVNTTEDGSYSATDLLPGAYVVTVSAAGFRTAKTAEVQVNSNTVARVEMQLEVGERADIVNVTAEAAALQTDQTDVHVSLGSRAVTQLPLPAYRNYQALINLVPGAAPVTYQNAVSGSPGRALATNINGTNNSSNNTRLDGASNMRASLPAQNLYVPPTESIEVVNVSTNTFDAEQGFAGGAAINVITKSGTNSFHGVIFEHHLDSGMKARNFFDLNKTPAKDIINNYGGTIGGPIRKNKLFFFASWEGCGSA